MGIWTDTITNDLIKLATATAVLATAVVNRRRRRRRDGTRRRR
ncbi:hypothetical protein [Phytohabitans rumicis]|nr:hypothetical protein [Phytohabitans rumicis]